MASLYKNKNIWYLSVTISNKRTTRSLRTTDYKVAKRLKPYIESQIILELTGLKERTNTVPFPDLAAKFLKVKNNRSINTQKLYEYVLHSYLNDKSLPTNPNSRAIFIRTINACWNWGLKQGLIDKANKLEGDIKGEPRLRVYTKNELDLIFSQITDKGFNSFVRFAYYTGARSGEIRRISRENVTERSIVAYGKTGRRIIKLNSQAQKVIKHQDPLWSYTKDCVSHKFKKEVRRLEIKDARFHDLRRTFGLNLIKQGMSIYKVSKLLGHSSVRTTELHYAPLLTVEIEDFEL
jgi:integrase